MNKVLNVLLAATMAVPVAAEVQAADLKMRCDMKRVPRNAGLSKTYFFGLKDGDGRVVVSDEWILHYMGAPVHAKISRNDAKSLVFKWTVKSAGDSNSSRVQNLNYRGHYVRATNELDVRMRPSGYDPLPGTRGKCTPVK